MSNTLKNVASVGIVPSLLLANYLTGQNLFFILAAIVTIFFTVMGGICVGLMHMLMNNPAMVKKVTIDATDYPKSWVLTMSRIVSVLCTATYLLQDHYIVGSISLIGFILSFILMNKIDSVRKAHGV